MRPVVVTAVLLLVVLMFMSPSAAWDPGDMCRDNYPAKPCKKKIGEGWVQMGNDRCVKAFYNTQHLAHHNAEKACTKYPNGHLVSIHNEVDLCQVECAMYRATTGKAHYWIGLYRILVRDLLTRMLVPELVWTDGTKNDYVKWWWGQPDNNMGREGCIEMNYANWGYWNDAVCDESRPYVCQVAV